MAEGSNNLTTYYAKRIIGDNAAASPDKALLQTGTVITSDEWILNQTARYNESPSKKYGILYNYDSNGHDVIEFWGNKPDTNNNNNPIPSVSITLDSGNTEIMGTLDVVESTLLQSTLTVNNTSLFKNTVTIQMVSPTLILDSTASGAVDWTIKNNQGIFTIDNNNNNSLTQILGNSTKGWQIDERLYINTTIPDSPNYTLYVSGKTYVSGVSYLNGQVGIGYNPETSGNTHKLYVDGTTYLTDHLYIGRTNSSHIYLINKNWTKGSIPSSQTYSALEFNSNDSTNNRVALLEATLDTSGNSQFNIFLVPNIANSTSWSGIVLKKTNEDILTIYNQGNTEVNGRVWIQAGSAAGSNVNRLETTAGMPGDMQYNQSRRGTQIYANGIAFADPYNGNSNNDAGWIRQIETTASSGYLEIATGDDGNEPIYVRQYKTDNTIARTFTLLDGSGNSSIPGHVDMPNETSIKFKIARKKADGGGWAYNPIQIRGNDDVIFSRWGVYGSGNDLSYIFFGVGDYNTTTHIRIDSSGHLVIPNDGIYYQGTKEKYRMIRFIDNTADTYGNGISIGGGGLAVLGSGESADTILSNLSLTSAGGTETTYIASDGAIYFYTNQNSYNANMYMSMNNSQLLISGSTSGGMAHNTTNPKITFVENQSTQPVHIIYTDQDSYRSPAGLKIVGGASASPAWLEVEGSLYLGAPTATGTGIYWNPYVESASDASDAGSIYQIKAGVAGGTELRISQLNDATDCINICTNAYIYLNSKKAFTINDAWLRINDGGGFSSGIYCGNSVLRTDGELWSDSVRIVDNWVGFYNSVQGSTRYGYIQANANRMYFRKENGVSTYHFDFGGHIYTPNNIYAHGIWANQSDGEKQVGVDNGTAGNLYLWSNNSEKGLYSGSGYKTGYVIRVTSSGKTFYGDLSGNATSATYLKDRTNSTASYLNYGASGLAASAITWLCCWNGYEVRAISKAEMANAVGSYLKVNMSGADRKLEIRMGTVNVGYNSQTSVTFSPAFSNACSAVIPWGAQLGFASGQSINVGSVSRTGCKLYQYNAAGVACVLSYIAFGY